MAKNPPGTSLSEVEPQWGKTQKAIHKIGQYEDIKGTVAQRQLKEFHADPATQIAAEKKKEADAAAAAKAAADKTNKTKQTNVTQLQTDIKNALAPEATPVEALSSDFTSVNDALAALPGGGQTSSPALNSAIAKTTAGIQAGQAGVGAALAKIGPDVATMEKDLPYADVIATTLQAQKNKLLYGSANPYSVSTKTWSPGLQQIYKYITGASGGTAQSTNPVDQIPTALKNQGPAGAGVPGPGNASTGL